MKLKIRTPVCYSASEIATWHVSEEYEPGKWRPARCCPFFNLDLMVRLRLAWRVFIGKNDALRWGDNSGEWNNSQVNYKDILDKDFKRVS